MYQELQGGSGGSGGSGANCILSAQKADSTFAIIINDTSYITFDTTSNTATFVKNCSGWILAGREQTIISSTMDTYTQTQTALNSYQSNAYSFSAQAGQTFKISNGNRFSDMFVFI